MAIDEFLLSMRDQVSHDFVIWGSRFDRMIIADARSGATAVADSNRKKLADRVARLHTMPQFIETASMVS